MRGLRRNPIHHQVSVDLLPHPDGQVRLHVPLQGLSSVPHVLALHELLVVAECISLITSVPDDAQGGDAVVKLPQTIAGVEDIEDIAERERQTKEHDCILSPGIVTALEQPKTVSDQLLEIGLRKAADLLHCVVVTG